MLELVRGLVVDSENLSELPNYSVFNTKVVLC